MKEIILHCSATKENADFSSADIKKWHLQRGFKNIGYHYVIRLDGTVEAGRKEDEIGAHCLGHNKDSLGICYIGGLDSNGTPKDTRTNEQKKSLVKLVLKLMKKYNISIENLTSGLFTISTVLFAMPEATCPQVSVILYFSSNSLTYNENQI